jgi:hypothetical protein
MPFLLVLLLDCRLASGEAALLRVRTYCSIVSLSTNTGVRAGIGASAIAEFAGVGGDHAMCGADAGMTFEQGVVPFVEGALTNRFDPER